MADSSIVNEEPTATVPAPTAFQATPESSSEHITADEIKQQVEDIRVKPDQELPQQIQDETTGNVDSTTIASVHTEQDQQTYANLEPILVAMGLGQEILQGNSDEHQQTDGDDGKNTVDQMEEQPSDDDNCPITQSDISSDTSSNVVSITQEQLASLFANSGGGAGGNVIVTSLPSDGITTGQGLSLATILQDVVSGIQQNGSANIGSTTVLGDSTGTTGSYYLVTQGGTIPIVMPSGIGGSGMASINLVQASSTDPGTTYVTVNHEALSEGVDAVMTTVPTTESEEKSSHLSAVQAVGVDTSDIPDNETIAESVSNDHELASAAAAVENETTSLQESVSSPVPVVTTGVKRRLSNGPRVCEQCNKAFKYPSDLKKHLQIHTDIKKFKCDECNRFFRRLHQLIVHQRIHSGEKPYICKHCGTTFRHDSTLTMHVRTRHEHKRPFKCEFCEHTFGRLSHLRKHVKKVCGPNKQEKQASTIFQCKFCEVVFPTKIELRKHTSICEKKESKAKPNQVALHVCNICNKDFASPYNVRRHQLTHSDDRPYECEYCSKSFKEKSSLTKHVKRVHVDKCKDESMDENSGGEQQIQMVGIADNQEEQFEVVTMSNDEGLLAAQSSIGDGNEAERTRVDANALAQVAASVMVEELMHGEDQNEEANPPGTTTIVSTSAEQQHIFITEKSAIIVSDGTESCMPDTSAEVTTSEEPQLSESCLPEESSGLEADSSGLEADSSGLNQEVHEFGCEDADGKDDNSSVDKSGLVEEGPGNDALQCDDEQMELGNDEDEVVRSTETNDEQVSM